MVGEEHRGQIDAVRLETVGEPRPNTGGAEVPQDLLVGAYALAFVYENVLHGDDVAFHAHDLGYCDELAGAIGQAAHLDHHVDGARDLLPHGALGQLEVGHRDHGLEPAQRVPRGIGVERGERAVVAGVHGLQHVDGLGAATLTHDDPVGPHT